MGVFLYNENRAKEGRKRKCVVNTAEKTCGRCEDSSTKISAARITGSAITNACVRLSITCPRDRQFLAPPESRVSSSRNRERSNPYSRCDARASPARIRRRLLFPILRIQPSAHRLPPVLFHL